MIGSLLSPYRAIAGRAQAAEPVQAVSTEVLPPGVPFYRGDVAAYIASSTAPIPTEDEIRNARIGGQLQISGELAGRD